MDKQDLKFATGSVDENRRRLTKGCIAAPVVLATLASKNALASSSSHNCTISGKLSGNTSTHGEVDCRVGRTPGYWKTHQENWCIWIGTGGAGNIPFGGATAGGATLPDAFYWKQSGNKKIWVPKGTEGATQATLMQVLDSAFVNDTQGDGSSPYAALARHVIAAVLNALCPVDPMPFLYPLPAQEAINMYNEIYSKGYYTLPNGETWTATQCTAYIQTLMK